MKFRQLALAAVFIFFGTYWLSLYVAYAAEREQAFYNGIKADRCTSMNEFNQYYCGEL